MHQLRPFLHGLQIALGKAYGLALTQHTSGQKPSSAECKASAGDLGLMAWIFELIRNADRSVKNNLVVNARQPSGSHLAAIKNDLRYQHFEYTPRSRTCQAQFARSMGASEKLHTIDECQLVERHVEKFHVN